MATQQEAYVGRLTDAFEQAARTAGEAERFVAIAGHVVRIRIAGSALAARLLRAFAHIATSEARPAFTILAWDSRATRTEMPPPAWPVDAIGARGAVAGFSDERFFASFQMGSDVLSLCDRQAQLGMWWTRDAETLPRYEDGAPFRGLLHVWAESVGLHLVHAAAVGGPAGAVVIAARGGTGKSTTAVACALGGLRYLADDYAVLACDPPRVHSLFCSAKVAEAGARRLPGLAARLDQALHAADKRLFFLDDVAPGSLLASAPVRFLLVPRFAGGSETSVSPAGPRDALLALAPSTVFQQAGAGASSLRFLGRFVSQVPARFLDLGSDVAGVPHAIASLLGNR